MSASRPASAPILSRDPLLALLDAMYLAARQALSSPPR